MTVTCVGSFENAKSIVSVNLDGEKLEFEQLPVIIKGRISYLSEPPSKLSVLLLTGMVRFLYSESPHA